MRNSKSERSTRAQLEAIITRYFQGLTDHQPVQADYDARCDRFHSGNRITHSGRDGIEVGTGDDGCYESNLGPKPWGPATETRIAVVGPERGIVIGYAVLYYGNSTRRMQINEVSRSWTAASAWLTTSVLWKRGLPLQASHTRGAKSKQRVLPRRG